MKQEEWKCWDLEGGKGGISFAPAAMGLNNNLEFMGRHLHVQTENTGHPVARIVTQVFCGGRVVLSRKSECPSGDPGAPDRSKIRELMHTQHFQVIHEIAEKQTRIMEKR